MGEGKLGPSARVGELRQRYEQAMLGIRTAFEQKPQGASSGTDAVIARSSAVDSLIQSLWSQAEVDVPLLANRVALVAVGGYGRRELFPYSDVDLMFLLDPQLSERDLKDPIRRLSQELWDCGLRLSPITRTLTECERFNPENVEFTLALLDSRFLVGDQGVFDRLSGKSIGRLISRERKRIFLRVAEVTRVRHRRYGNTLFHLEPNVKDCPGGLRDAHLCAWMARLGESPGRRSSESALQDGFGFASDEAFRKGREFLLLVRTFLHFRHLRDDNTLDWHAQDEAAAISLGVPSAAQGGLDAAYWMRLYFRHARSVAHAAAQALEELVPIKATSRLPGMASLRRLAKSRPDRMHAGFEFQNDRIVLKSAGSSGEDPAHDPEVMMEIFAMAAKTGARLSRETEQRLESALPLLSAHLEDGPGLWQQLEQILIAPYAGTALRAMHAMGILELVLPEFHGIDALVIRDAYHRYTVDEHTLVLIDTLHALMAPMSKEPSGLELWSARFTPILRDLPHPGLLFLAALLHDTGKGHSTTSHAAESVRMAESVVKRLELDSYEAGLVLGLIRNHLEMSAALRRDVFEGETIRTFAARVPNPEALRMLTVFTYADIFAVHPDALTPWKAENLHHLYVATAHYLDRNVDDERVGMVAETEVADIIHRVSALVPGRHAELERFLAGLPQRYLLTRTREEIRAHFEMALRLPGSSEADTGTLDSGSAGLSLEAGEAGSISDAEIQLEFRYAPESSVLTLVSRDRPMLFANMAGALAAWGMNIVTADAFSNARGVIVDTFRFTDSFRTLELNTSERDRFVESVKQCLMGVTPVDQLLAGRRRRARKAQMVHVKTHIQYDDMASGRSTLLEVVAQDTPGLLRALTLALAAQGCNIEVALVDTEGEMAIDVFYVTAAGSKLDKGAQDGLRHTLIGAIEANAN